MNRTIRSLRRRRGTVAAAGTAATLIALAAGSAGTAAATPYATGWSCISPFASYANSSYPGEEPAPSGVLDSLLPTLGLSQPASLIAEKDQRLQLNNLRLSLSFKDPRPAQQLYRRTGGISVSYRGIPLSQAVGDDTLRTLSVRPNPGAANADWWSYSSAGTVTYVEAVATPWAPPSARGGGYIAPSASLGHQYVWHTGDNAFPIDAWVAVQGTNTAEGVQVVRARGVWTVNVEDATPGSPTNVTGYTDGGDTVTVPTVELDLSSTSWTPNGAGAVEFKLAGPGTLGIVQIQSQGYDRPGYNRPLNVRPFGSVYVRAHTMSYGASNDCIPGAITIANNAIPASFWGNASPDGGDPAIGDVRTPGSFLQTNGTTAVAKGAAGRWGLAPVAQPAFAVAPLQAVKALAFEEGWRALTLKPSRTKKVSVRIANPSRVATTFKVTVKSVSRYKVGTTRKVVTATLPKVVAVGGGSAATVSLSVSKTVQALLKTRSAVKVVVTVTPVDGSQGGTVTKTATITR